MSKIEPMTEEEIKIISFFISRKVFKKMCNEVNSRLKIMSVKHPTIRSIDFINIVLTALVSLDTSVIIKLIVDHKAMTGQDIDPTDMFNGYVAVLMKSIQKERDKMMKESMN